MLIWGTRWTLVVLGQLAMVCSNCGRETIHSAMVNKGKFTLFFIPLFPIGRKYLVSCNVCGLRRRAVENLYVQLEQWDKTGALPAPAPATAPPPPALPQG